MCNFILYIIQSFNSANGFRGSFRKDKGINEEWETKRGVFCPSLIYWAKCPYSTFQSLMVPVSDEKAAPIW